MKPLVLSLAVLAAVVGVAATRKPPGKCMPYAEMCLHCTDCRLCKHCAVSKGKCSVCWNQ